MKYEFEIRGEFEAETPEYASKLFRVIGDYFSDVLQSLGVGKVTGKQLAMKGKLQEKPLVVREFVEDDWEIGIVEFYGNTIELNLNRRKEDD